MSRPAVRPVVWDPPAASPRVDPRPLPSFRTVPLPGAGPEDVVVDSRGLVITGVDDGRILRVDPIGGTVETIADTGGRPLGLELLADDHLLVCDATRGLLEVTRGAVHVLVDRVDGVHLRFCSNVVAAPDGTIYFTQSSQRFGLDHWRADIVEHSGTGRLLRRDPSGAVEVVLDGLQFANGLVLDGTSVIVAETGAYRLTRVSAGTASVLVDALPGFPDNLGVGSSGLVWVAMPSPRNRLLDRLHRWPPVFRRATWALPERLQPQPHRTVWVLGLDRDGRVVQDLETPGDTFSMVAGVAEHDGRLYLGSLTESAIGVATILD